MSNKPMTKEQEELNKEIEEAGRKIFKNGTGQDTRYDYLQELRREGFMEGALTALTTESIYSKAGLRKEQWISVVTPPNELERVWLLFEDNSVGEGVLYEGNFGYVECPSLSFYPQPIKWMRQFAPAPPKQ